MFSLNDLGSNNKTPTYHQTKFLLIFNLQRGAPLLLVASPVFI